MATFDNSVSIIVPTRNEAENAAPLVSQIVSRPGRMLSQTGAALVYPLTGVHDSMSNFFAIARSRLLDLAPAANGSRTAFEAMVRAGPTLRVFEIPIVFRDRARGRSKMSLGIVFRCFSRWLAAVFRHACG